MASSVGGRRVTTTAVVLLSLATAVAGLRASVIEKVVDRNVQTTTTTINVVLGKELCRCVCVLSVPCLFVVSTKIARACVELYLVVLTPHFISRCRPSPRLFVTPYVDCVPFLLLQFSR